METKLNDEKSQEQARYRKMDGVTPLARRLTVLLFFCASSAHADPVLTKTEATERLKRENLALLAAKHRLTQARAETIAAGVWENPNLRIDTLTLTHGAITGGQTELSASIDQTLPIWGTVGLRQDVAEGRATAEERAFAASLVALIAEERGAYVELQRAQEKEKIARAGLADLDRVDAIVKERAAAGANAPYDRVRVALEKSKLDARVSNATAELYTARGALARSIGKSVDARTVTVEADLPEPAAPTADVNALVRRALASRPDVASARARYDASELAVTYRRRIYYPSPTLSLGYARFFAVPGEGGGGAMLAGLSLPIPLLDHGQGSVDRAVAEAAEQRAVRDATELDAQRDIEIASATLAVRVDAWKKFRDTTAPEMDRLRTIAELAYKEGRMTILELLDAYSSYLDARERQIDLKAAAARAVIDLERALGAS